MDTVSMVSTVAPFVIPIAVFVSIMTFIMGYLTPKMSKSEERAMFLIDSMEESGAERHTETSTSIREREIAKMGSWSKRWYTLFERAGVGRIEDPKQPGTTAFMFALIGMGAGLVILKIPGLILGPFVAIVALNAIKSSQASKKNARFDAQLGLLIDSMTQNLSGAMTPANALVASIDGLPDPLYSELLSVKYDIQAGTPIDEVLQELGDRNESREMKFLSSALRISISQGGDLVKQLKVISEKLESRARITRKINEMVSQAKPTIMVVALATPVSAIYSYTREGAAEAFSSTIGMIATVVGFVLYGFGLFIIMKTVNKTKEF